MSLESVIVELSTAANVSSQRVVSVTLSDATVVIDGTTYHRTSPLRSRKIHAGEGPKLTDRTALDAWQVPVAVSPTQGETVLPIFSASGT